jgi:hypothetical protein
MLRAWERTEKWVLLGKPKGRKPLGRQRYRWEMGLE